MTASRFADDVRTLRERCQQLATGELRGCHLVGLSLSENDVAESAVNVRRSFVRSPLPSKFNRRTLATADISTTWLVLAADDGLRVESRGLAVVEMDGAESEFAVLLVSNDTLANVHGRGERQREDVVAFVRFCEQAELWFADHRDELSPLGNSGQSWLGWLFAASVVDAELCRSEGNGVWLVSGLWLASLKAIDRLADSHPQKTPDGGSAVRDDVVTVESNDDRLEAICGFITSPLRQSIVRFLWHRKHWTTFDTLRENCWRGKDVTDDAVIKACRRIQDDLPEHLAFEFSPTGGRLRLEVLPQKPVG